MLPQPSVRSGGGKTARNWQTALQKADVHAAVALVGPGSVVLVGAALFLSGSDIPFLLWNIQQKVTGPESLGIYQSDPVLGWKHQPSTEANAKHLDFSATYTIGRDGMRPTGSSRQPDNQIWFLGGSFTFGHGVNDDQAFPSRLALGMLRDYEVVNAAQTEKTLNGPPAIHAGIYHLVIPQHSKGQPRREGLTIIDTVAEGERPTQKPDLIVGLR